MNRRDFNKLAVSVPFVSGIFFNEKNTDRALTPIVLQEVADKHLPAQNKNKDYDFNNEDWQYLCGECLAKEIETEQQLISLIKKHKYFIEMIYEKGLFDKFFYYSHIGLIRILLDINEYDRAN